MPITKNAKEVELFLEEAKSMVQIGEYHDHIVNLQGLIYDVNPLDSQLSSVSSFF